VGHLAKKMRNWRDVTAFWARRCQLVESEQVLMENNELSVPHEKILDET
jgi:hypothetical protein